MFRDRNSPHLRHAAFRRINPELPFLRAEFFAGIDTSVPSQCFTTDCEVCCRPFEVAVECEPGEILSLDVRADLGISAATMQLPTPFSGFTSSCCSSAA